MVHRMGPQFKVVHGLGPQRSIGTVHELAQMGGPWTGFTEVYWAPRGGPLGIQGSIGGVP